MSRFSSVLMVLSLPLSLPAFAQNLVPNATFPSNVSGWTATAGATVAWAARDASGSASSGSALVTNASANASTMAGGRLCVASGPGSYTGRTRAWIPSGQPRTGFLNLTFISYASPGCAGSPIKTSVVPGGSQTDRWLAISGAYVPPATVQSTAVILEIAKSQAGGQLQAYFDDVVLTRSAPATLTVPAAASIHGSGGTFFHSDLWVVNRSHAYPQTLTATYRCFSGQNCGSATQSFVLSPRQSILYSDVVGSGLFHAAETAGAIELTYEATVGHVTAGSRVYTPSLPSPTKGASIPALPSSEARKRTLFPGLASNGGNLSGGFRSNAGVYNPNDSSAIVTFTIYNGATGTILGAPLTRTWGAHEAYQVNDIFAAVGAGASVTTNAYLVVSSTVPVFPHVTVIDNQSGDSSFVSASDDEAP